MGELQRVSRTSTSSAAPLQPLLRCAPERAAAPGKERPRRVAPGCLKGHPPEDAGAKSALAFLSA